MAYKQQIIQQNQFFGGISDDPRIETQNQFQESKHFDIFSNPRKLTPYRSLVSDTETSVSATDLKQYFVRDFVYASGSAKLYGLGQTSGGLTKIVYKADATSGLWTLPISSDGNGVVKNECFFEYKDYLWGFQGTNQIFKYGVLSGTPSITNSASTVASTITSVANGIIAADGNAYMAYNNVVVRIQPAGTITDSAKTVPDTYKITSLANYGSYMAIGCSPKSGFNGQSKVFIWNLSSDLFADTIDWGEGDLRILENIEGVLVGVTDLYLNNSSGAGKGSMLVKTYSGGSAQAFKEVFTQALTGKTIPLSKIVKNGRVFWSAKIMTNSAGTEYIEGLWSFGRKNGSYPFAVALDVVCEEADTDGIQGFGSAANFFFIAHSNDGSIQKTDDESNFDYTSSFKTQKNNFGDTCLTKRLDQVTIYTSPLPSGASVTVKCRFDDDTSPTTIGTYSTQGGISRDFFNIEATSAEFPSFQESEFIFESEGGAEITGYKILATPLTGSSNG